MSVIVAIKYRDGVALAADKQATFVSSGNSNHNAVKITKMKYSNTAIGVTGSGRDGDLISVIEEIVPYKTILDEEEINAKIVIKEIVPKLFEYMKENDRIENRLLCSNFLFCTNDKMFLICRTGSVTECKDFATSGCGDDLVTGYLNTLEGLSAMAKDEITEILKIAIQKSCQDNVYIDDNIDFIYLN